MSRFDGRATDVAVAIAGLALPLAFAPAQWWWLPPLSVAVLFLSWQTELPRVAARRGFLFGAGLFLTGTYWLYHSIHVLGDAPLVLALFLMLGLVAVMGLYHALLGYLVVRAGLQRGLIGWLIGMPAAWVLLEWWRGWFLTGFPWLSLGYSQTDTWLGFLAPVAGIYGISLALAISGGVLLALLRGTKRDRIAALAVLVALWSGSFLTGRIAWTEKQGDEITATLVQGGIPQEDKWLPEMLEPTMELFVDMTEGHWNDELIVWPEAAIPALIPQVDKYLVELRDRAAENGSTLLLGILDVEIGPEAGDDIYRNTLLGLGTEVQYYNKRHLVPFGEFFPVPAFVRSWMRLQDLPYSDFEPGAHDQAPLDANGIKIAPSICYEDAYGSEQRVFFPEAALMVNVSNDAWFGDTIAPHQHLQISRLRAMEARRYLLRATNNGISAIVGPKGRLLQVSGQFEPEVLSARVQPLSGETAYVRLGNWPVIVLCVLLVGLGVVSGRRATS